MYEYKILEPDCDIELYLNRMAKKGWKVFAAGFSDEDGQWTFVMERKLPDEHPPPIPYPASPKS